ncbi:flippase [Limosilactobacillus reuteri]|uniref:flippase n=1 Tax=Limosilactobacillus reuteri TaxID=1598 RepID=UPI00128B8C2A|nr:flippase [Limosilactobacillus reuteri]MQB97568.1 flippase [Limosilactobacillus reuteri]
MDKKIASNFIYNFIYQFLTIALPIVTVPYISRVLGPQGVGEYNYVNSIVSYFGIFAVLGTVAYGQREIARQQFSKEKKDKKFSEIFLFRIITTSIVFCIYSIFILLYKNNYYNLFLANYFLVFSWALDVSWYFQGVENFRVTAVRNGLVKIIATISVFIFVKGSNDTLKYMLIYTLSTLLGNLTMFPFLKGEVKLVRVKLYEFIIVLKGSLIFFVPVIAIQIFNTLNKVMLGITGQTKQVGYYSQAVQILNLCVGLIYALSSVLLPRLSYLYAENEIDKMKKYMYIGIKNTCLMGLPMCIGCLLIADIFVPVFFGSGYQPVIPILYVLCPLFVVIGIGQLLGVYLLSVNRQWQNTLAVVLAVIINIIGNYIVLFFNMKAYGVAVITLITEATSTIIQMIAMKDYISFDVYIRSIKNYVFPCLLMSLVVFIIRFSLSSNITSLLLSILGSVIIYLGYLLWRKDEFIYSLFASLFHR